MPNRLYGTHYKRTPKGHAICAAAAAWSGWGTALKPAWEPIIVARKPLEGTVIENCLNHGCGALNIDGGRVTADGPSPSVGRRLSVAKSGKMASKDLHSTMLKRAGEDGFNCDVGQYVAPRPGEQIGRWPANLIHDGSQEVLGRFPQQIASGNGVIRVLIRRNNRLPDNLYDYPNQLGTVGIHFNDCGSAARFFYCAKAGTKERGKGNSHPTVKPLALMRYLLTLVTQPQHNRILDPFCGSGSTLLACRQLGLPAVGIDSDPGAIRIARRRLLTPDS